ncbi:MAG: hypothetical protein AAF487_09920 [Bacteroidota bacterium]
MTKTNFIGIIATFLLTVFHTSHAQINGLSFEAPSREIGIEEFELMNEINANWVCLMPYAYSKGNAPEIYFDNFQWWGERYDGTKACIKMAKESKLRIMLKPHLWISHGKFTGDQTFDNEESWKIWERDYMKYILTYAKLAEEEKVELFCIGTELKTWFIERPEFWQNMIREVKKVYSGKLTYAGNWDGYKLFPFWDQMDFIGVDAYFPLNSSESPSISELNENWNKWKEEMRLLSVHYKKDIILTEFGYRNITKTTSKPWESYTEAEENQQAQANAYSALFQSLWNEEWLAGGFMWKWVCQAHLSKKKNTSYSPQGKRALEVIKAQYSK